jgi:metal-responsive CopG/Arc/MetJ family transcriptional regulator
MTKVLISMPEDLLARLDKEVSARRSTRSRLVEQAVRRELGWPATDELDRAVERARAALSSVGSVDTTALIRRDRDTRDARP